MFKKPTKKQLLVRRIVISIVATISVVIIATFSILFMLGYRLDSGNGRLEQGALLQFDSIPSGAQVWINDVQTGSQTATKQTVRTGAHSFKMTRDGYEDWNRMLSLESGTLTWLDYARLVPKNRPVEQVGVYTTLAGIQFSPDMKWALVHEAAASPTLRLVDLRSNQVKSTFLTIPTTLYAEADTKDVPHTFSLVRWSTGSRYALVKHGYADNKLEWLLVDTQDIARTVNVTESLNVALTDVRFAGTSGQALYGLTTDGTVRKLDISGGTISRALVSNVKSFNVYEENSVVSYVGTEGSEPVKNVAGIYKDGENAPRVIRSTSQDVALRIAVSRYFGDDYLALAENNSVTIMAGSLPTGNTQEATTLRQFAQFNLSSKLTSLSFNVRGEFVLAQAGSEFISYEIEHKRSNSGVFARAEGQDGSRLKWLDRAHLWNDDNNQLSMRDFDGINLHVIMPVQAGFDASLSQNGRYFYGIGKTKTGEYQLQRVRMILQ